MKKVIFTVLLCLILLPFTVSAEAPSSSAYYTPYVCTQEFVEKFKKFSDVEAKKDTTNAALYKNVQFKEYTGDGSSDEYKYLFAMAKKYYTDGKDIPNLYIGSMSYSNNVAEFAFPIKVWDTTYFTPSFFSEQCKKIKTNKINELLNIELKCKFSKANINGEQGDAAFLTLSSSRETAQLSKNPTNNQAWYPSNPIDVTSFNGKTECPNYIYVNTSGSTYTLESYSKAPANSKAKYDNLFVYSNNYEVLIGELGNTISNGSSDNSDGTSDSLTPVISEDNCQFIPESIINIAKTIMFACLVIGPILAIVLTVMDFLRAFGAIEIKEYARFIGNIFRRLIYVGILIAVPVITNIIFFVINKVLPTMQNCLY